MIEFLTPSVLWALPLLSIPVILHFLKNIRPTKIDFSSIRFLKNLQKENLKKLVFLQYLLLLLRLLFMLFLILAFAQPKWNTLSQISFANKNIIVAMDRSFSVYQNSVDNRAAPIFRKIISDLAKTGDSQTLFQLMTNDGIDETFELKSVEKIYDFFGEVHYAPGDLYSLVNKILGRLQVSRETIVLIFSDNQLYEDRDSTSFNDIWNRLNSNSNVYFSEYELNSGNNDGIIRIDNFQYGFKPSSHIRMDIQRIKPEPVEITFFDDKTRIAQKNLDKKKQNLRIEIGNKTTIRGIAELESDFLAQDNQYFWGIDLSNPGRILFGGDTSSLNTLKSIANIEDFRNTIQTKVINPQGLYGEIGGNWDWLFFSPQSWSDEYKQLLKQYLRDGTKLFLVPGSNSEAFSEAIKDLTGKNAVLQTLDGNQQIGIKSSRFDAKLANYPIRAFVQNYFQISSRAMLRFDNGNPLIGRARGIYFLTAPLNKENGNIHLHPGLPIWFFNWLPQQSRINAFYPQLTAGQDTVLQLTSSWKRYQQIQLNGPSSNYVLENHNGSVNLPGKYINQPGHYSFDSDFGKYEFAVNIASREFEQDFFDIPSEKVISGDYQASQSISLWKYFLILAIIFLLLETLIRYKNREFTE